MGRVDIAEKNGEYFIIESVRQIEQCSGIEGAFDSYIEDIDEMVALPIVELMKKGYKTEMSCSGHDFYSLSSCEKSECTSIEDCIYASKDELFFLVKDYGTKRFFISFMNDYFKERDIPDGWRYEKNESMRDPSYDLFYEIGDVSYFELVLIQAKISQQLLSWIEKLPDISKRE